jgi:hypothetical protein
MSTQFENPKATKLEEETISKDTAKKEIERVAETAAVKSSKTEQHFDKDNSALFSK